MSVTEQQNPGANTLEEIGAELSGARAERGMSLADASATLRLAPANLEALEKGDLDALPAATYAVGYLRSYARLLGLDADGLCRRLHNSLSDKQIRPEYTFVADKFPRRGGAGRMALAGLVVLVVGYGGWYAIDVSFLGQGVEPVSEETVETVLLETPVIEEAPIADRDATGTATLQLDNGPDGTEGAAAVAGLDAGGTEAVETPPVAPEGEDGIVDNGQGVATAATVPQPGDGEPAPRLGQAVAHNRNPSEELVLKALATSWVEISRPDGSIVSAWLMREGDEYIVPGDQDIYLTVGNAGGLEIGIAGDAPRKLGEWGETISELPLDSTLLKDRY